MDDGAISRSDAEMRGAETLGRMPQGAEPTGGVSRCTVCGDGWAAATGGRRAGGQGWRCVGGALICEEIIISERFRGVGFASIREGIPETAGGVAGVGQTEIFIFTCNLQ